MDNCQNRSNLHKFRLSNAFGNQNLKTSPFPVSQNIFYLEIKASPAKRAGLGDVERSARRKIWEQKEGGSLIFFLKKAVPGIFLWCGEIFRRHGKVIFSPVWRRKIHLSPLRGWGYLLWQPNNFLPFRTVSIWLNWSATHVKTMCCEWFRGREAAILKKQFHS